MIATPAAEWVLWMVVLATRAAVAGAELTEMPPPPAPGTLVNAYGMPLDDARFSERAREADFVAVGESHPSACDHRVQARLVGVLAREGRPPAIGMEMIAVDEREPLERFNRGRLAAPQLEEALRWAETWGFPFALYQPIFEQAERYRLPVVALNAPRDIVREAARNRWTAKDVDPHDLLPPQVLPPPDDQRAMLVDQFEAHAAMGGSGQGAPSAEERDDALERFVYAQSIWDTKMAQEAARAREGLRRPVVILAGTGHIEHGWGIASRLARFAPGARLVSLVPWRGDEPAEPDAADLFFYCPEETSPATGR